LRPLHDAHAGPEIDAPAVSAGAGARG